MPNTLESLKSQVYQLTPAERVDLAAFLLDQVDPDTGHDPAWQAEIARRVAEIRSRSVSGRPVDDVIAELQSRSR